MIFVDTSAIFALADGRDARHDEAARSFEALLRAGRRLVTHSYVLVESMALLQRRLGRGKAIEFASVVAAFEIEWVGERLHNAAVLALGEQPRGISLVDQVSFLVMRRRGIDEAFAFDADFTAAGFRLFEA
jgi:predicted nucleic acid-binding protein